ncbi:MAG: hypothetical protein EON59_03260 [Alphaproteobacteria bacterium]|nr:MAG: hypothetical protein EON59_03260 [Alphaproteobacteria bacterium]
MSELTDAISALNALTGLYAQNRDEWAAWSTGPADGGPTGNGYYPLTLADGETQLLAPSPAKIVSLSGLTNDVITTGTVAALIEDRAFAAQADLYAELDPEDGLYAIVTSDADPAKNGLYRRDSSETAGWAGPSDLFGARVVEQAAAAIQPIAVEAASSATLAAGFKDEAATSAAAAAASVYLGIATGNPTSTTYDTFTAHNRNSHSYVETTSGTDSAIYPMPARAAGSTLVLAYQVKNKTGTTPFIQPLFASGGGFGTSIAIIADGAIRFVYMTIPAGKTLASIYVRTTGGASGDFYLAVADGTDENNVHLPNSLMDTAWKQLVALAGLQSPSAASISDAQLKAWAAPMSWPAVVTVTDANGAATTATITWPDGTPGVLTMVRSATWGGVDSYTATYVGSVTKTVTQSAITRDATTGVPSTIPALTVA